MKKASIMENKKEYKMLYHHLNPKNLLDAITINKRKTIRSTIMETLSPTPSEIGTTIANSRNIMGKIKKPHSRKKEFASMLKTKLS
jgi:hypothetical protein